MKKAAHLQLTGDPPANTEELMQRLFWKNPELAPKALEFTEYIKEWSRTTTPYRVSQWSNYCTRTGLTQSQYHNILRRLRRAGLVEKKYNPIQRDHELQLSGRFSRELAQAADQWRRYLTR